MTVRDPTLLDPFEPPEPERKPVAPKRPAVPEITNPPLPRPGIATPEVENPTRPETAPATPKPGIGPLPAGPYVENV